LSYFSICLNESDFHSFINNIILENNETTSDGFGVRNNDTKLERRQTD